MSPSVAAPYCPCVHGPYQLGVLHNSVTPAPSRLAHLRQRSSLVERPNGTRRTWRRLAFLRLVGFVAEETRGIEQGACVAEAATNPKMRPKTEYEEEAAR
jgi:hypothetical protein